MAKKREIIDGEDVPFWNFLTGRKLVKGIVFPDTPRAPTRSVVFDAKTFRIQNPKDCTHPQERVYALPAGPYLKAFECGVCGRQWQTHHSGEKTVDP